MTSPQRLALAEDRVWAFTAAAAATGAIPVPGASAAIVAENAALMVAVADAMGIDVQVSDLGKAVAAAVGLNALGRTVFVEAARAMGWFAGPLGVWGVSALGATTAGLQTWTVGQVTIAICNNAGRPLAPEQARRVIERAEDSYDWQEVKRRMKARA